MGSRGLWAVCVSASFAVMLVGCSKEGTVNPVSPAAVSAADLAAKSGSAIPAELSVVTVLDNHQTIRRDSTLGCRACCERGRACVHVFTTYFR